MENYLPCVPFYLTPIYFGYEQEQEPQEYIKEESEPLTVEEKREIFIEAFKSELTFLYKNSYIKEWTEEEDRLLLEQGPQCKNWNNFSQMFKSKSGKVCLRRYRKLKRKEQKWPSEVEKTIKRMRENEKKSWLEIADVLKFYTPKKIRERYQNYLKIDNKKTRWTVEEDLKLWNKVEEIGKNWKKIQKVFENRSGLQLRNRYYKFLEPTAEKVKNRITYTC